MLQLIEEIGWKNKVKVVFCNTRMEMDAMYRFVEDKRKEGWDIEEIYPELPMPIIYKQYGVPFHSKYTSEMIYRLQRHNFNFKEDTFKSYDELIQKYPNCQSALLWLTNNNVTLNAPNWIRMALYENGDKLKIANKCCEFLKKKPFNKYSKENGIQLRIVGVRADESQLRKAKYNKCIWHKGNEWQYFPLVFFTEKEIWEIIEAKKLKLSDAYTVYGCQRTGCFGCPFSQNFTQEVEMLKINEPNKAKACEHMYKEVYDLSLRQAEFKQKFKEFRDGFQKEDWQHGERS